jgi:hypothetical protein
MGWTGAAMVVASLYQTYAGDENAKKQREQQDRMQRENLAATEKNRIAQEQATNKANQKKPDYAGILYNNQQGASSAAGGSVMVTTGTPLGGTSVLGR